MKVRGGYSVRLAGAPSGTVEELPSPEKLGLPLKSRRFTFSDVAVKDAEKVRVGQVIARDPSNYLVPLLAPAAGTIRMVKGASFLEITELTGDKEQAPLPEPPEGEQGVSGLGDEDEVAGRLGPRNHVAEQEGSRLQVKPLEKSCSKCYTWVSVVPI